MIVIEKIFYCTHRSQKREYTSRYGRPYEKGLVSVIRQRGEHDEHELLLWE